VVTVIKLSSLWRGKSSRTACLALEFSAPCVSSANGWNENRRSKAGKQFQANSALTSCSRRMKMDVFRYFGRGGGGSGMAPRSVGDNEWLAGVR
jgi:hypothetical protein